MKIEWFVPIITGLQFSKKVKVMIKQRKKGEKKGTSWLVQNVDVFWLRVDTFHAATVLAPSSKNL